MHTGVFMQMQKGTWNPPPPPRAVSYQQHGQTRTVATCRRKTKKLWTEQCGSKTMWSLHNMQVHVDACCSVRLFLCMKRHVGTWRSCLVFWSRLTLLRPAILAVVIDESVMRTVVCNRRGILFQYWSFERETLITRISGDWKYRRS
jgi:hypothetical protein